MRLIRVLGKLEPGGAQLAVLRLTRELLLRHGVHTTLLVGDASPDGTALARKYGVDPVVFRSRSRMSATRNLQWQRSSQFASWLGHRMAGADIVHAHMVGAWWAASRAMTGSTPLFATEHNQVNWTHRRIALLQPVAGRVDRFFAMGPAAHRFAVAAGVRPEIIEAAISPIEGLDGTARTGLRSPRLTFSGRLCEDKGPDVLIDALAHLGRKDLSVYLLGGGPLRDLLVDQIRRRGLSDRVIMPGWVDDPWSYIAGSTIHVVPSREEAWSQSAALALGVGVPVVGTDVDGLRGTLACSRGITVPPEDPIALSRAIAAVLDGRATTDTRGAAEYGHQFSAARVADHYHARYQEALTERARSSSSHRLLQPPIAR